MRNGTSGNGIKRTGKEHEMIAEYVIEVRRNGRVIDRIKTVTVEQAQLINEELRKEGLETSILRLNTRRWEPVAS